MKVFVLLTTLVLFLITSAAFAGTASIQGVKFNDLNKNGIQDAGEPGIASAKIAVGLTGGWADTIYTDATGHYSKTGLAAGSYTVTGKALGCVTTSPVAGSYVISLSAGEAVTGKDFGSFELASVIGSLFEDLNENGVKDAGEPGLPGWAARLVRVSGAAGMASASTVGVTSEQYSIDLNVQNGSLFRKLTFGIHPLATHEQIVWGYDEQPDFELGERPIPPMPPPGVFDIRFIQLKYRPNYDMGFWIDMRPATAPSQTDTFRVAFMTDENAANMTMTWSAGLGEFLQSCMLTNSLDAPTLSINMLTDTVFTTTQMGGELYIIAKRNPAVPGGFALTGPDGAYSFRNVLPGTYVLNELTREGWTEVGSGYTLTITSSGEVHVGKDIPSMRVTTVPTRFFTVLPESIAAVGKDKIPAAIKRKPTESYWEFVLKNTGLSAVSQIHIQFKNDVDASFAITCSGFPTVAGDTKKKFDFSGGTLAPGDSVIIAGYCAKAKPQQIKKFALGPWPSRPAAVNLNPALQRFLLPKPNFTNLVEEVYSLGGFVRTGGLRVGKVLSNPKDGGWVVMKKSGDLLKSLRNKNTIHNQGPAYFQFTKAAPSLSPAKVNNKLFAEVATLKLGIAASALGITLPGLGELQYVDPSNALNGLTVSAIAAVADSFLTCRTGDIMNLFSVIHRIDSALAGPIDTISFSDTLLLQGAAHLSSIPFLTKVAGAPARIERQSVPELPESFELCQNYPNPFNPTTTIRFVLPAEAFVTLKVYNILGQEIATLLNSERMGEGAQEAFFNGAQCASGVYFYRLVADGAAGEDGEPTQSYTSVKRMLLLR